MPKYIEPEKKELKVSYSVFVAMPRTPEQKEFCVVRDSHDPHESLQKLKMPGGSALPQEVTRTAAAREIFQETGARIMDPNQVLIVVHKPSMYRTSDTHHTIFFKSDPPLYNTPLRNGLDIDQISWMSVQEIDERIAYGEFHANHAAAFWWYMKREEYLREKDDRILAPIVRRPRLSSWSVLKDETLIFCYDENCTLCH